MQDAFGGILNIVIIAVFLVIVEGILAFTVSYTKAFRMKNYVISAIEQYEGSVGCFVDKEATACKNKINLYADQIHYKPADIVCHGKAKPVDGLFCYEKLEDAVTDDENSATNVHYRIVTQVDINFPIVNQIMGLEFFQVSGDTRVINKYFER